MDLSLDQTERWRAEYAKKGIPSSFREEPSGSVCSLVAFLRGRGVEGGRAIDIGAGTGRNSLYLADQGYDVLALELVPDLVLGLRRKLADRNAAGSVTSLQHDVTTPWPIANESLDVAIDTFCYKHQVTEVRKLAYRRELARVVKPAGYFLLALAGHDDGYYASLLDASPDSRRRVIIDPANQLPSVLYTRKEIEQEFGESFTLIRYDQKHRRSEMHGASYDRSTHVFIFQRKPQQRRGT